MLTQSQIEELENCLAGLSSTEKDNYLYEHEIGLRVCSVCGKLMPEGYCQDMGYKYYCSDECLHTDFTDEEWKIECEENDQSYWTVWNE